MYVCLFVDKDTNVCIQLYLEHLLLTVWVAFPFAVTVLNS